VIGDGPLKSSLQAIAAVHSVRVSFRGVQSPEDVLRTMSRARILCNPSVTAASGDKEGFGMVFAEAQAVGTPVVSFWHGAIPEIVNHQKTGLLCPEGDINGLANALRALLDNATLWKSMSRQASQWVREHFDISNQTEQLELIYDECISNYQTVRPVPSRENEAYIAHKTSLREGSRPRMGA
jgi:colanic acid/amylovoran biosynthesis glycosyltransferase